jgi:drug/metabolite transporter (DMT)-like permease
MLAHDTRPDRSSGAPVIRRSHAYAAAGGAIVLWATTFPVITIALRTLAPAPLAATRFLVAALLAAAWMARLRAPFPARRDWPRMLACGAIGIASYNVLLNLGERRVPPGVASFLVAVQPVFAALLSAALGQERLARRAWVGLAVAIAGVGVVSLRPATGVTDGLAALAVLAAAACSGCYFVLQRPLVARYGPVRSAGWTIIIGASILAPWAPRGLADCLASREAAAAVIFLGVVPGLLGYALWLVALDGLGAPRAASLLVLMAPLAATISIPLAGQAPDGATIIGGGIALAGVAMVNRRSSPR